MTTDSNLIEKYNYDVFEPAKFGPWMRFDQSPALWEPAPDHPLWTLENEETSLSGIWSQHSYTVVEFGSFT